MKRNCYTSDGTNSCPNLLFWSFVFVSGQFFGWLFFTLFFLWGVLSNSECPYQSVLAVGFDFEVNLILCPNPSVTRSATKVQLNLKLGFFSRRLWTWDKRQTKSATVRPQICNYSATYKPLLFFQRDGPRGDRTSCDRPRLTDGTSRDGPIPFSCIFVARGGENFISRDKIKSTAATSL